MLTAVSAAVLFLCSSLRHLLFQSSAFDLSIFDQGIYLLSVNRVPIVTLIGHHLLGDHAAFILYPIALLYKIYPSVYWLFLLQAIALASGGWLTEKVALQAGLTRSQSLAIAGVYWLYPVVFNVNLFDFHPEVLAIPAIFGAVWAARAGKIVLYCACVLLILSTKAVLSLTVAAMGIWLLLFEKKRSYGGIAIAIGIVWFIVSTQLIIPAFSGREAAAVNRYSVLGNSVSEIILNLLLEPGLVLQQIFTLPNLFYLILLFIPIIWGLSWQNLTPLWGIIPTVGLNLLSASPAQKDLVHQYSLPALPFLLFAVIASLSSEKSWLKRPHWIVVWAAICFLALAKFGLFWTQYLESIDTWQATRGAIAQINTQGGVLTASQIAPHLAHRPLLKLALDENRNIPLEPFDYVLLNIRHPGWNSSLGTVEGLRDRIEKTSHFQLKYQQDDVMLWAREKDKV
ncbi:DUF2079 domain-containing protein [Oscillatoria sp. FACHB-1406]|uniref:DUF2079 domain-containing protein n=1 Tax=Oscillatoria sp. FACHB-1406 TaxID=2692846 RepID=UPI001689C262|nr:DUF2079 domain-containing protein [Oscillatoria sp. FACHB-1406]MBD2576346.1 DUF2079 domain-containing protein [Oscillatoria sp. FACHB-1406]